ncbi:MAG: FAD:protein FMN transferase [Colwellia sp.]|nr:FAD:protein FMN transferase [Colwellia sp.]
MSEREDGFYIAFVAMASPCEIIIETVKRSLAKTIGEQVSKEVWRIEDKYSRYNPNSLCSEINRSNNKPVTIDDETFALLNFADTCYQLSEGVFDITSGVLRKAWCFDCTDNIPDSATVTQVLKNVGWQKVTYDNLQITLPAEMELDFGGIAKEYAVDRAILLIKSLTQFPALVNLGGDLATNSARKNNQPWQVGVQHPGFEEKTTMVVSLFKGALATSGDAKRYLLKDGRRYSHILNAKTGWPIENAPRAITVSAPQCIQAGILATLSQMQGNNAEQFLTEQDIKHWVIR